ncbi:replication-relaxation family protein [Clostridium hydrogeniformans]|uniref:replication-relaxation family protein n=1 Tax=Clostridium hydrogeniformans TaxID=349933 RepID=UPI000485D44D|nr:replication-relaxation family protein [Clostridium hydrogeniformans]
MEEKIKGKRNQKRVDSKEITDRFILDFKFTTVQEEAIKLIYEMRILSTSQISDILDRSIKYVRNQLLDLYKNGFLYRSFNTEGVGQGSKEAYWMLDRGGALFIAGAYGISVKKLNWDIRDNLIKFEKLAHSMKISDVRTALEKAAHKSGHKINTCLCDRHLYYEFINGEDKYILRPDLFLTYNDGNKIYQYFFEIDMGTMTITGPRNRTSVVISKIPKYESFMSSREWEKYFDVYPRIIFLTTTKSRALYMAEAVKNIQKTNLEILFSTFEVFEKDPLGESYGYLKSIGGTTSIFN